jgi:hypothetical protein
MLLPKVHPVSDDYLLFFFPKEKEHEPSDPANRLRRARV